jgi:hypothetical protein
VAAVSGYLGATSSVSGPAIAYQWQAAPFGSQLFTNVVNATNSIYAITNVSAQQNGLRFRVGLTTAGAGATSSLASLTVSGAPVTLMIQKAGNQVQLLWPSGTLQSATVVTGPYTNITSAVSPYTLAPAATAEFFRVHLP